MNALVLEWRKLKKTAEYLTGYVRFDRTGNNIVRRTNFAQCPHPVLLLYGFMSTRRVFEILENRLRRDKFCVWSINLGGLFNAFNTECIETTAKKVAEKIDRLYTRFPQMGPLSIVGHSMGGLIGRYYVQNLGGDKHVKSLITLASPHNGSRSAYVGVVTHGLISQSIWQMLPNSRFMRELNSRSFPSHVRFASLYSKEDRVNKFPDCVVSQAQIGHVQNHLIDDVRHREFVMKRSVYRVIRSELASTYNMALGELDDATGSKLSRIPDELTSSSPTSTSGATAA